MKDELINLQKSKDINSEIEKLLNKLTLTKEQLTYIKENLPLDEMYKSYLSCAMQVAKNKFTSTEPLFLIELSKKINEIGSTKFGILCLSEINNNLIMWSHYANSHLGFVIGFDSDHHFFDQRISTTDKIRHLKQVVYTKERSRWKIIDADFFQNQSLEEDIIDRIFFTKGSDWEDEKEWRIVLPLSSATEIKNLEDEDVYLFSFPAESISEIILGSKMTQKTKQQLFEIISNDSNLSHIKIKEASLNYYEYSLLINNIEV